MRPALRTLICSLALVGLPWLAAAQEVGTIAAVDGTAEVRHDGAWTPAAPGTVLHVGDGLRTGPTGRLLASLGDDSALNVGGESDVVIERIAATGGEEESSHLKLERGSVRAVVGGRHESRSRFEILTPVAIAAVTGTEFVMTYDPVAEVSDVVGVAGTVQVNSSRWPTRRGVAVTAQEVSTVKRGAAPARPTRIADARFRQYIEDLEFVPGTLAATAAARGTRLAMGPVPPSDQAGAFASPPTRKQPKDPSVKTCWAGQCWVPGDPSSQPPNAVERGALNVRF